jgi:glucan phosphoethanolaminetransferase (alkaline phosphatase superfamily)
MGSITLAQAALFAALATVLLTGYYLVDNAALLNESPALVLLGSAIPSIVWAGFFFIVYWSVYRRPASVRTVAWITLVFAVILEAVVAYIRFQQSVNYWTPFGNALSISGWLLRLGWAVFLISFALSPDNKRTRAAALVLAIIAAPSALSTAYDAFNNGIGLLFDDIPKEAFWRVLITPAIRTVYWVSQILFLWSAWGKPEMRNAAEASSARFAP